MNSWSKFWKLSSEERQLLIQALVALPLVIVGLRLFGLRRTQTALGKIPSSVREQPPPDRILAHAQATARLVDAVGYRLRATCLRRSVTLWWLLHRRGIDSKINLGAHKATGQFKGHAWVELNGIVLNDHPCIAHKFTPFPS